MKLRLPISVKFATLIVGVLVIVISGLIYLVIDRQKQELITSLHADAVNSCELVMPVFFNEILENSPLPLAERVGLLLNRLPESGTTDVYGASGNLILSFRTDAASKLFLPDSVSRRLFDYRNWIDRGSVLITSDTAAYFWVISPLVTSGVRLTEKNRFAFNGVVVFSFSADSVKRAVREMTLELIYVALAFLALGTILAIGSARIMKAPVNRLILATEEYKQGHYDFRINRLPSDEIGDLILRFHEMAEAVQSAISNLESQNRRLNEMTILATEKEATIRGFLETAQDGIVHIDHEGTIRFANHRFKTLTGMGEAGENWWNLVTAEERVSLKTWLEKVGSGTVSGEEARLITLTAHDDRRLILELTANAMVRDNLLMFQLFLRDVTEQRHLQELLAQSRRMESIGRLAGGVAHDFNNLLAVIIPNTELIRLRTTDQKILEHTDQILTASQRAAAVIRQLVGFSSRRATDFITGHFHEFIRRETPSLKDILGDGIQLDVHTDAKEDGIRYDETLLHDMLVNLALFSKESMNGKGLIQIDTQTLQVRKGSVLSSMMHIRWTDSGKGIPEEQLPAVFEPFFAATRVGEGTSLGLPGVYSVIMQHHGSIDVASSPGQGTTFNILLPVQPLV
ncbi:MAG: PAS domain S-box protein [Bacteroidetes bacterium]|nr:PAS domain S-box protein [Bacteroidota bacterium]